MVWYEGPCSQWEEDHNRDSNWPRFASQKLLYQTVDLGAKPITTHSDPTLVQVQPGIEPAQLVQLSPVDFMSLVRKKGADLGPSSWPILN